MRYLFTVHLLMLLAVTSFAAKGIVTLKNGQSMSGDITRCDDGSCWVATRSGTVKFDKGEIRQIKITSTKDSVSENFIVTLKNTPSHAEHERGGNAPRSKYDDLIHQAATKHKIDPTLVKAVMKAESNFNPLDRSCKGACGLMQLMPETARLMGVKNIYNPAENVNAGAQYLRYMLDIFDGNIEKAVAAYNAGPGAVKKYAAVPPYRETRKYVHRVKNYLKTYGKGDKIVDYTDDKGKLNLYNIR